MVHADERLSNLIAHLGRKSIEANQIARRLRHLLPERLRDIHRDLKSRFGYSKALRLALVDRRYEKHIEELVDIRHAALDAKIRREAHLMLFKARQSLQSFERAQLVRRKGLESGKSYKKSFVPQEAD